MDNSCNVLTSNSGSNLPIFANDGYNNIKKQGFAEILQTNQKIHQCKITMHLKSQLTPALHNSGHYCGATLNPVRSANNFHFSTSA